MAHLLEVLLRLQGISLESAESSRTDRAGYGSEDQQDAQEFGGARGVHSGGAPPGAAAVAPLWRVPLSVKLQVPSCSRRDIGGGTSNPADLVAATSDSRSPAELTRPLISNDAASNAIES